MTAGTYHTCLLKNNVSYCFGHGAYGQLWNTWTSGSNTPVTTDENYTGLGPGNIVLVAPGNYYTCGLLQDGNIYCWGYNNYNQFGRGSTGDAYMPRYDFATSTPVTTVLGASYVVKSLMPEDYLDNVVSVDWSGYFVDYNTVARYAGICALQSTGKVRCWGNSKNLIFGDGTTVNDTRFSRSFAFREVQDLANATELQMSDSQYGGQPYACALVSDGGKVKCWGYGGYGQLGDGTNTQRYSPITVSGIDGATAVYSGYGNSCALIGNELRCWGYNGFGQLGNNSTASASTPVTVQNLPDNFTIYNTAMADKSMSAGNSVPTLCVTKNAYTGNLGGLDGANSICQSDCGAGYKFAITGDMGNFPASAAPGGYYWISWIDGNPQYSCTNWTVNAGNGQTESVTAGMFSLANLGACTSPYPLTCVKGVR